jgi:peptidyl-prolyl cis-trans isomerase B (cyclophilin B)
MVRHKVKPKQKITIKTLTVGDVGRRSPLRRRAASEYVRQIQQEEHRVVDQGPAARGGAGPAREGDGRAGRGRAKRRQRQAIIGSAIAVVVIAGGRSGSSTALRRRRQDDRGGAAGRHRGLHVDAEDASSGARSRTSARRRERAQHRHATLTMDTNLGADHGHRGPRKAPCTARRSLPGQQEVLGQHQVPPAGHRGHQGAAVRRPDRQRQGLPRDATAPAARASATPRRTCRPARPAVPAGTIAMAKTQAPGSTGSQFFIVYGDTHADPSYTCSGTSPRAWTSSRACARPGTETPTAMRADVHPKDGGRLQGP